MKYVVDANVLSEPTKPVPDPRVVEWLRVHERHIAVDPIILGELRFKILIFPRAGSGQRWNAGLTGESGVSIVWLGMPTQV